jgi:hypothetical protein
MLQPETKILIIEVALYVAIDLAFVGATLFVLTLAGVIRFT